VFFPIRSEAVVSFVLGADLPRHRRTRSYRARHSIKRPPASLLFVAWVALCFVGMWLSVVNLVLAMSVYGAGVGFEISAIALDIQSRRRT
jgi:hypothetical protein